MSSDEDFAKSVLSAVISLYGLPKSADVSEIRPPTGWTETGKAQPHQLPGKVVDIRLKRILSDRAQVQRDLIAAIPQLIDGLDLETRGEADLDNAFAPLPVKRAEVPKHVAVEEADRAKGQRVHQTRRDPQWNVVREEQNKRLKKSEEEGKERAKRRMARMQQSGQGQ